MTDHIEQPMPMRNDHVSIQSLVRADLEQREQVGIQRYGTALQPNNGRDALRDLYEELLDGACYIKQAMVERQPCRCGEPTKLGVVHRIDKPCWIPVELSRRTRVVCICGPMRFENEMHLAAVDESLAGRVVVMPHVNMKRPLPVTLHAMSPDEDIKHELDALHLSKIQLADEVLVVTRYGYVGDSTRNEIAYAKSIGKPVRYWAEQEPAEVSS